MRFSSNGTSDVIGNKVIDTGTITNIDNYMQNMAEFRYQNGSFNLTSEYVKTNVNRVGNNNLEFSGAYVMSSYFLTGEKYGYDAKLGSPMPDKINNNAFEIAGRISTVNLNNKDIRGGKLNSYDFGVNYYPNPYMKFMINYSINKISGSESQASNPQYLMLRMQANF